ncbi:MAG: hypothetical protein GXN95_02225 [Methanococci archaeon]|nr:hypothetical protein [Methanococci archaeon]
MEVRKLILEEKFPSSKRSDFNFLCLSSIFLLSLFPSSKRSDFNRFYYNY